MRRLMKLVVIWTEGVRDGLEDCGGWIFDDDPESFRSRVYDRGRNFGNWLHETRPGKR